MTFLVYLTKLESKFNPGHSPPQKRLSAYGTELAKRILQYKTKYYASCCPHCLNGTVRLDWDPYLNAHTLTCIMCSWTFNQNPEAVKHYV